MADIESIQLQDLQGLVKNTFGEQVASSNNAITLIQRLWDSVENHRKLFGNRAFADSDEQKKFAKILADMQTK